MNNQNEIKRTEAILRLGMSTWIDTCLIHLYLPIFEPLSEVVIEYCHPHPTLGKLAYTAYSNMLTRKVFSWQTNAWRGLLFGKQNVRSIKKNVVYYKIRNKDQKKWMITRSDDNNRSLRVTQTIKKKDFKNYRRQLTQDRIKSNILYLKDTRRWPSFLLQTPGTQTTNKSIRSSFTCSI